jgi:RNA-directed DNA polymerase
VRLGTPESVRKLQRKLYLCAKQDEVRRFYTLYDKVYREDILWEAWRRVKANKGAGGVDDVEIEDLTASPQRLTKLLAELKEDLKRKSYRPKPVSRVYIPKPYGNGQRPLGIPTVTDRIAQAAAKLVLEPIIEADLEETQHAYRPKRNAHQAVEKIRSGMRAGRRYVIDADLSRYFDTIRHDKLMKLLSLRVSDGSFLSLVKSWLKSPVVERGPNGHDIVTGGRNSKMGTPQGGVLSPCLANLYLNVLARWWRRSRLDVRYNSQLVQFADDLVILSARDPEGVLGHLKLSLKRMDLVLNEEKTRVVTTAEGFDFVGYRFRLVSRIEGATPFYPLATPSPRSQERFRQRVKEMTCRQVTSPLPEVIAEVNGYIRGWSAYYRSGNPSKTFGKLRHYAENRVRRLVQKRSKHKGYGYSRYPNKWLYNVVGLHYMTSRS